GIEGQSTATEFLEGGAGTEQAGGEGNAAAGGDVDRVQLVGGGRETAGVIGGVGPGVEQCTAVEVDRTRGRHGRIGSKADFTAGDLYAAGERGVVAGEDGHATA